MTSATREQVNAAKNAGVQASLWDATREDMDVLLDALRTLDTGEQVSANTVRAALDRACVLEGFRAGLMRKACALGLLEPVMTYIPGEGQVQVGVPSRGLSAKGAYVKLYRRTAVPVPPPKFDSLPPPRAI